MSEWAQLQSQHDSTNKAKALKLPAHEHIDKQGNPCKMSAVDARREKSSYLSARLVSDPSSLPCTASGESKKSAPWNTNTTALRDEELRA